MTNIQRALLFAAVIMLVAGANVAGLIDRDTAQMIITVLSLGVVLTFGRSRCRSERGNPA
jgi:hypothetical protein